MDKPDARLIVAEFALTGRLLKHACARGNLARLEPAVRERRRKGDELEADLLEIMAEYERIWLYRNRPGGLKDSLARFEIARRNYLKT